ncbi:flavodoxin family protein [Paraburkholderia azotifigens]|uniref:Flavodoxin family protein n=1 Tax=Paraburkholderia azotifigens TaxID=2057004 RepID=A0A5C6VGC6_9BURK|nr:flavodoxin family protein [Paraburkholderia azotifigens]TXC84432.1 flavodoxin family protein [Paraburkholderia azotifigens]
MSEASNAFLVVYFSRSGRTRRIAEMLASELGADVEPICERNSGGAQGRKRGYVRSLLDAWFERPADLLPALHDVSRYDVVVVASAVWASHASAPAVTWLKEHGGRIPRLALFCCVRRRGHKQALKQMMHAAGKPAVACCVVTDRDVRTRVDGVKRQAFARKIRHQLPDRFEKEGTM